MENREERIYLLIGLQISLIIHLFVYILLNLIPKHDNILSIKPIELSIEEIKEEKKEIIKQVVVKKTENKENNKKEPELIKGNENKTLNNEKIVKEINKNKENSEIKINKEKTQKSEPDMMKLDEENLKLLNQLSSGSGNKSSNLDKNNEDISFGEKLSDIDKNSEGSAISRYVLFKPHPPSVSSNIIQPSVKAKIWINPSGNVEKVDLITKTGDIEIDSIIIRYLKQWKFNKISKNETQWATITIRFK